jgi:predicted PurR-regulated permease PerM
MSADGVSTRAVARSYLTIALLTGGLYLLYLVRSVLLLVVLAVFVAVAVGPAVDALARGRASRVAAILVVYAVLLAAIVGIGLAFVPPMSSGVQSLSRDAPGHIAKLRRNATVRRYDNQYQITKRLEAQAATLPSELARAAGTLSSVTVGAFREVTKLITVLAIAFFLLLDGRGIANWCLGRLPPDRARRARKVSGRIYHATGGYIAGNLLISLVAGTVSFVTLTALGVPYALPLSVLMALLDLVPLVGATTGALIVGIITVFTGFPTSTIVWAIVQIIYQQIENNVLTPVIYRRTVKVHGLVTLIAVLIGAVLLGVLGALIAIPIAAALQILVADILDTHDRQVDLAAATD